MSGYPQHQTGHNEYMRRLLEAPTIVHALKVEAALNKRVAARVTAIESNIRQDLRASAAATTAKTLHTSNI